MKEKIYRYSFKERDNATGLYYYGMRYYAPWLGRWLSPDPAGTIDGPNLYAFVRGNPITLMDIGGMGGKTKGSNKFNIKLELHSCPNHAHPIMSQQAQKLGAKIFSEMLNAADNTCLWDGLAASVRNKLQSSGLSV